MKVRCKKDFYMHSGEIAFIAGVEYEVIDEYDERLSDQQHGYVLIDEQGYEHDMPYEDENEEFFEVLEGEDKEEE